MEPTAARLLQPGKIDRGEIVKGMRQIRAARGGGKTIMAVGGLDEQDRDQPLAVFPIRRRADLLLVGFMLALGLIALGLAILLGGPFTSALITASAASLAFGGYVLFSHAGAREVRVYRDRLVYGPLGATVPLKAVTGIKAVPYASLARYGGDHTAVILSTSVPGRRWVPMNALWLGQRLSIRVAGLDGPAFARCMADVIARNAAADKHR